MGLHGVVHDPHQFLAERGQVHLIPQLATEGGQRRARIGRRAVEAPVDDVLHPPAQGLEQGGSPQRGDDDGEVTFLAGQGAKEPRKPDHQRKLDDDEQPRERAVPDDA